MVSSTATAGNLRKTPLHLREALANFEQQMADYQRNVGARLRAARERRGFSQEGFAHAVGVSVTTAGAWERGESAPRPKKWQKIGEVLAIDADEIRGPAPVEEPAQLDRLESELREQRQMLEALLESIKPGWRELLRPPPGLLPPDEGSPNNERDPDESETPPEDPELPRS